MVLLWRVATFVTALNLMFLGIYFLAAFGLDQLTIEQIAAITANLALTLAFNNEAREAERTASNSGSTHRGRC